jgi:hypothetical protein
MHGSNSRACFGEYGYNEDDKAQILRLMEWVLMLPETYEQQLEEFYRAV